MELFSANLNSSIRRATADGRQYLIAPITLIVPGVLNGSQGALYYPPDEIARNFKAWAGKPITVYHPAENGQHVSASHDGVLGRQGVGYLARPRIRGGKLQADGWFEVNRLRQVDNRVLKALQTGRPMEISTGLYTDNHPAENGANDRGRPYAFVARNYRPDHLAVLPDQRGACSLNDGCGLGVNTFCATGEGGGIDPSCGREGGDGKHDIKLPKNSRKLNIDEANAALKQMGYKLGSAQTEGGNVMYDVTHPSGKQSTMSVKALAKIVYGGVRNTLQPHSKNTGRFKRPGAGTGKGELHEAAQRGGIRLTHEQIALGATVEAEAQAGHNPPSWVEDEAAWDRAKELAERGDYGTDVWAVVTHIYQNITRNAMKTKNAFCPTGPGGGQDNSCGREGGGGEGGGRSIEKVVQLRVEAAIESGKASDDDFNKWNTGAATAHDRDYTVGSVVKVDKAYGGKSGVVVGFDRDGSFALIKERGGNIQSYHNTNLRPVGSLTAGGEKVGQSISKAFMKGSGFGYKPGFHTKNVFCPTGEGGGQDNSCGREGGGDGGAGKGGKPSDKDTASLVTKDLKGMRAKHIEGSDSRHELPKKMRYQEAVEYMEKKGWKVDKVNDQGTDSWKWKGADTYMTKDGHRINVSGGQSGTAIYIRNRNGTLPSNNHFNKEASMPTLNQKKRSRIIEQLVSNCGDCGFVEEDREVLNDLSDDALVNVANRLGQMAMVANACAEADLECNELPDFIKKKIEAKKEADTEDEDEEEEEPVEEEKTENRARTMSTQEWMRTAPTELQKAMRHAIAVENRERQAIVARLTANVADGDRERVTNRLKSKSIEELTDLLAMVPATEPAVEQPFAFNFSGAASPATANREQLDDVLPLPVMNFDSK